MHLTVSDSQFGSLLTPIPFPRAALPLQLQLSGLTSCSAFSPLKWLCLINKKHKIPPHPSGHTCRTQGSCYNSVHCAKLTVAGGKTAELCGENCSSGGSFRAVTSLAWKLQTKRCFSLFKQAFYTAVQAAVDGMKQTWFML